MSLNIRSHFGMVEKMIHFLALPSIAGKLEYTRNTSFPSSKNMNQPVPDGFGVTDVSWQGLNFLVTEKTLLGRVRGEELWDGNLCPKVRLSIGIFLKTNKCSFKKEIWFWHMQNRFRWGQLRKCLIRYR